MAAVVRRYFYYLNERGHLFHVFDIKGLVEGTRIPSGPTHLRDRAFLDFFYLRLQYSSLANFTEPGSESEEVCLDDGTVLWPQEFLHHFPYVSICGKEMNFLKVQDAPVVFTDYSFNRTVCNELSGILLFGESLQEPLQPAALTVTREGKLLHPITTLKKLRRGAPLADPRGLVGAQVGLKLGFDFVCEELDSDGHYVLEWGGKKCVIPFADE
ncbi:putative UPF0598 protein C8orf82 [Trypanosoma grayi]|uniref:putative UPF0598 protein C8orf82 n=1 Tax=Trypanosoma grayi TaxID=71804 RepID=UPI0004F3FA44|nr:putative UPF0598 protein C8orf82 [Trypanosoma grayi]KEG10155.1 putative UPF0598 protein C8orf82 [Trypanosoma grayi]